VLIRETILRDEIEIVEIGWWAFNLAVERR
jgi:hypothetical protein